MPSWTKKQTFLFLLQWMLWTYAAFLIFYRIVALVLQLLNPFVSQGQMALLSSFIFGALTGFMQWLTIRKVFPKTALWIPATGLAWALTFAAIRQIARLFEGNVDFLKLYWLKQPTPFLRELLDIFYGPIAVSELDVLLGLSLILGVFLGLAQFALLKPYFRKAALWIPLNIAASYLAYRLAFSLPENGSQFFLYFPLHTLLTGLAILFMLWKYKKISIDDQETHEKIDN